MIQTLLISWHSAGVCVGVCVCVQFLLVSFRFPFVNSIDSALGYLTKLLDGHYRIRVVS